MKLFPLRKKASKFSETFEAFIIQPVSFQPGRITLKRSVSPSDLPGQTALETRQ
tara:strand:- start:16560 stop:16721 length:162 start_codon:yes stop_codon:yes gene_type:complete